MLSWIRDFLRTRFILNGDDTITDIKTGLMWASSDNGTVMDWHKAKDYCDKLTLGGYMGWRLPSDLELMELYKAKVTNDRARGKGLINLTDSWVWTDRIQLDPLTKEIKWFYTFTFGNLGIIGWSPHSHAGKGPGNGLCVLPVRRAIPFREIINNK